MLGRFESSGFVSQGFDKLACAVAGQRVIIDDRDQWSFRSSHGGNVSQTQSVRERQFIFKEFDLAQLSNGWFPPFARRDVRLSLKMQIFNCARLTATQWAIRPLL